MLNKLSTSPFPCSPSLINPTSFKNSQAFTTRSKFSSVVSLWLVMEIEREIHGNDHAQNVRAEIDTSTPFRSVKEAVILFGEKVLAGEIANKLNDMRASVNRKETSSARIGSLVEELEDTKQNLEKAHEERQKMANNLASVREELHKTKTELKQLIDREQGMPTIDSEIKDIKFVENSTETETHRMSYLKEDPKIQRKKYVKFSNPPSQARIVSTDVQGLNRGVSNNRECSQLRSKQKKKSLLPMMVSVILKKKSIKAEESVNSHGNIA